MQLRLLTLGVCALTSPAAALLLQRPVPLRARHSSAPAAEPQLPHLCLRHGCGSRSRTIVAREMTDIENQEAYEALIADATKEDRARSGPTLCVVPSRGCTCNTGFGAQASTETF
jgi:hypothetical protein